jgi:hypothetical protein
LKEQRGPKSVLIFKITREAELSTVMLINHFFVSIKVLRRSVANGRSFLCILWRSLTASCGKNGLLVKGFPLATYVLIVSLCQNMCADLSTTWPTP